MKQSGIDPLTTRWVDATLRATAAPQLCYSTNIINVHQLREEVCRDTRRTQHILLLNSLTLWLLDSSPYPHNSACKNVQGSSRLISFFPLFVWCITRLEPLASSLCVYLGETSSLGTAQICNVLYTVNSLYCRTHLTWMHVNIMAVDNVEPVNYMGCKVLHLSA